MLRQRHSHTKKAKKPTTQHKPKQRVRRHSTAATPTPAAGSVKKYAPPTTQAMGKSQIQGKMRLVLFGAAGCGKGSFGKYISSYYNIPSISTGDIIRSEIKNGTELGQKLKDITSRGDLIDDNLMLEIIKTRLAQPDVNNGYILDGFPRTLPQAVALNKMGGTGSGFKTPNVVLNINLREDVLIAKAVARRTCEDCGTGYNLAHIVEEGENGMFMPAILPQKSLDNCDDCDGKLFQRADDNHATVRNRLNVYNQNAKPVLDFYDEQGVLTTWNVVRGLEDTSKLLAQLDDQLVKLGYQPNANL